MNTDALVQLIASRVIEELMACQQAGLPAVNRESVLFVGQCEYESQLRTQLSKTYTLTFAQDIESLIDPEAYDHIVLVSLTNSLLSALAVGLERGNDSCLIIQSLLLGKTVHILEEGIAYRRYRDTAKPAFYQLFEQKEATLCTFGMAVVSAEHLKTALLGQGIADEKNGQPVSEVVYQVKPALSGTLSHTEILQPDKSYQLNQRVVGEKDLRGCYEQGYRHITCSRGAIITPLAKDFVRLNDDFALEKL